MLGRIVYVNGIWQMWAGAAIASTITLSEKNLRDGGVDLQPQAKHLERWNRVRGKYVNPEEFYQPTGYIEQRSAAFEADDGGEPNYKELDFNFTKNEFECQRNAIITLKKSRNQRVLVMPCNWSALRLQPGITVDVDLAVFGFVGEKFMVTDWMLGADGAGIDLTLVQESDSVWTDPLEGDYTARSATAIGFNNIGVPPPTGLTASVIEGGVLLSWTNPLQQTYKYIEIHAANENVRASAVLIGSTPANTFFEVATATQRVRYYWIRAINKVGQVSTFEPNLTTTTITAYPGARPGNLINDPDFDLSTSIPITDLTALPLPISVWDTLWVADEKDQNTPVTTRASEVNFVSAGGASGSNAIKLIKGDPSVSPFRSTLRVINTRRIRANSHRFRIEIRYRNQGTIPFGENSVGDSVSIFMRGFDAEIQGSQPGFGQPPNNGNLSFAVTGATWTTAVFITKNGVTPENALFWWFDFIATDVDGNLAELEIDSVFIYPIDPEMLGATASVAGKAGLVPSPSTAERTLLLKGDGTWGGFIAAVKTADEPVTSSTTLQDDDHLTVTLTSGKFYKFEMYLTVDTAGSSIPGFKFQMSVPASSSGQMRYAIADQNGTTGSQTHRTNLTVINFVTLAANIDEGIHVVGTILAGATGTFKLTWAQVASSIISTKILKHSYLILTEIG